MFKNEKGSIPVAIVIGITSALTVLVLGNLLVAENLANQKQNTKLEQQLYSTRNTLETTVNVVLQKLSESRTKYEQKTIYPLYDSDMQEIENTLNTSILPHIAPTNSVSIKNLKNDKSLDMLCDETIATSNYTYGKNVSGVICKSTYFNMSFDLEINNQKTKRNINVKFNNLYPQESTETGFIKINYDNLNIDYSSL